MSDKDSAWEDLRKKFIEQIPTFLLALPAFGVILSLLIQSAPEAQEGTYWANDRAIHLFFFVFFLSPLCLTLWTTISLTFASYYYKWWEEWNVVTALLLSLLFLGLVVLPNLKWFNISYYLLILEVIIFFAIMISIYMLRRKSTKATKQEWILFTIGLFITTASYFGIVRSPSDSSLNNRLRDSSLFRSQKQMLNLARERIDSAAVVENRVNIQLSYLYEMNLQAKLDRDPLLNAAADSVDMDTSVISNVIMTNHRTFVLALGSKIVTSKNGHLDTLNQSKKGAIQMDDNKYIFPGSKFALGSYLQKDLSDVYWKTEHMRDSILKRERAAESSHYFNIMPNNYRKLIAYYRLHRQYLELNYLDRLDSARTVLKDPLDIARQQGLFIYFSTIVILIFFRYTMKPISGESAVRLTAENESLLQMRNRAIVTAERVILLVVILLIPLARPIEKTEINPLEPLALSNWYFPHFASDAISESSYHPKPTQEGAGPVATADTASTSLQIVDALNKIEGELRKVDGKLPDDLK
jgi:hypothetical protein